MLKQNNSKIEFYNLKKTHQDLEIKLFIDRIKTKLLLLGQNPEEIINQKFCHSQILNPPNHRIIAL